VLHKELFLFIFCPLYILIVISRTTWLLLVYLTRSMMYKWDCVWEHHHCLFFIDRETCSYFFCVNVLPVLWSIYGHDQGQLVYKGYGAAALPEILRKITLNIWIKVFVRRYVHYLEEYELIHCKFKYLWWILSAAEITVGCALPRPCALASAQLGRVVGDWAS
jgi:hypothetical protein